MIKIPRERFVKYIKNRVSDRSSKNFLALCTGATGSGKSYHMLALAEMLDPEFNVDRITFTAKQLMEVINSGTLKRGSVVIADEFGTAHFSRNFAQTGNILINFLLQCFRKFGYIFLGSTPSLSYIDKASRILFHFHFVMKGIDFKTNLSHSKPFSRQMSHYEHKVYEKYLRIYMPEEHKYIKLMDLSMPKPSKELARQYEEKKDKFLKEISDKIQKGIIKQEMKDLGQKPLTDRQKEVYELHKDGLNPNQIAERLEISIQSIYEVFAYIKRKGYEVNMKYKGK